jgi:hypothetical protein
VAEAGALDSGLDEGVMEFGVEVAEQPERKTRLTIKEIEILSLWFMGTAALSWALWSISFISRLLADLRRVILVPTKGPSRYDRSLSLGYYLISRARLSHKQAFVSAEGLDGDFPRELLE